MSFRRTLGNLLKHLENEGCPEKAYLRNDWFLREPRFALGKAKMRHRLNGHELEQAPGAGDGQGGLASCGPWGGKESDTAERLNNNLSIAVRGKFYTVGLGPALVRGARV